LDPSSLVRESVKKLGRPSYRTIPEGIVRMNDNSNLFMPNPVADKVAKEFDFNSLSMYPSVLADDLRAAVGRRYHVDASQVIVGNGSDEAIDLAVKTFIAPGDRVAIPVPTFEMYSMYAKIAGAKVVECPLKESSFQLDVDAILSANAKLIFLSSPNNPTGNCLKMEDLRQIIKESDSIVVLDEAYCDFTSGEGCTCSLKEADNLLLLKTLSKAYALPGLRVGFCLGSKSLVESISAVCAPFRLNRFSEKVAIEALADEKFVSSICEMARKERRWVTAELRKLGAFVYPSETNFILFKSPLPVKDLIAGLLAKKIAIRDCSNQPLLENCARVTFGNREVNEKFIAAFKEIAGGAK
jgi:histidinol-phosphate aminotransferase